MSENEEPGRKMELLMGLLIAVFAAALAINDLGAGRYGDDEKIAIDNHAQMYSWLQSKSIKQALVKGQVELLSTLEQAKAINSSYKSAIDSHVVKMDKKIKKYEKEMYEIQWGSDSVGKDKWIQEDAEGKLGNITGAEQWKHTYEVLGQAGDKYDMGTLFLQLCLVLGAIGLVIQAPSTRRIFLFLMIGLGTIGIYFTVLAYNLSWSV
jgi:hypothetical protein